MILRSFGFFGAAPKCWTAPAFVSAAISDLAHLLRGLRKVGAHKDGLQFLGRILFLPPVLDKKEVLD